MSRALYYPSILRKYLRRRRGDRGEVMKKAERARLERETTEDENEKVKDPKVIINYLNTVPFPTP